MTAKTVAIYSWMSVPVLAGTLLMSGCGNALKPPTDKVANAELAISRAQDGNAQTYAPIELRQAEDHLQKAKAAIQAEEYKQAKHFAEKALLDATLAESKAESETARQAAKEMRESIDTLRQETNR
ncbi:MAG: DUF4398 domain-containing protein [Gammaproteobacteria bacterium]|nr:MAG: DUF4398 domain-containing protein [Gammaproteobacteria bacterium]RKZ42857.1 MAG: DUF4398 domain-containing protein [Gammaproteobacteria bacterium]RKZ74393.1 MAG: DUF4398 domain-containing protein [Gammaproteobacteria bacterium]